MAAMSLWYTYCPSYSPGIPCHTDMDSGRTLLLPDQMGLRQVTCTGQHQGPSAPTLLSTTWPSEHKTLCPRSQQLGGAARAVSGNYMRRLNA